MPVYLLALSCPPTIIKEPSHYFLLHHRWHGDTARTGFGFFVYDTYRIIVGDKAYDTLLEIVDYRQIILVDTIGRTYVLVGIGIARCMIVEIRRRKLV